MTRTRAHDLALIVAALIGGTVAGGCRVTRPNGAHCFHAQGDQTCAEFDPSTPYCAGPGCSDGVDGCVAEPPADECYSPCGQDTFLEDDASCIEVGDESETDTETGTATETSAEECQANADCPDDAAYCDSGTCVPCDAAPNPTVACFDLTEGQATICLDGNCVECTADEPESCTDAALICDLETHTCEPCTTHDQCAGGAGCDLALGTCLPSDAVWHVDGDGGQDFLTVGEALAALGNSSGTLIIHQIGAGGIESNAYTEGIDFAGDRALVVLGAVGESPLLRATPVTLQVSNGARVYVRNLALGGEDAALVNAARLELDTVILAPGVRQPLRIEDSVLRMRNSMLRTVPDPAIYPALEIVGTSDIDIRYSTLLSTGQAPAISCQGAALVPGSRIRNSILANFGDAHAVQCSSPSYETNGLEDATGFVDNTTIGNALYEWFTNWPYGDLHLGIAAPIAVTNAARWSEGDPLVDYDGDPRPAAEGSQDFVGADRVP